MASVPLTISREAGVAASRSRGGVPQATALLMAVGLAIGIAVVLVTTPIGSGDYGQWLMTSRYYAGQSEPAYRAISDVPPLVPWGLAMVHRIVADPVAALQVISVALLWLLAGAFYLTGATLLGSRLAGLVAAAVALLATDQFLALFTFGGLLQAAAIGFTTLSVAAFAHAPTVGRRGPLYWSAGSIALVLAAVSHLATGALGLVAGAAVAVLSVMRLPVDWRGRLHALVPVAVCLSLTATWWVVVLLPGSAAYVSNPASLNYRGPERLVETLTAYWPTIGVIAVGVGSAVVGAVVELRRRRVGPFAIIATWCGIAFGSLGWSIVSGAATDYPRFTTLLLAPLAVAAAGGVVAAGRWVAGLARRSRLGRRAPAATGLVIVTVVLLATVPSAVGNYREQARGYQLTDLDSLRAAASWIDANVPSSATVLAPVREGKWIEGLTGRASLFANPVRYSFRPGEWTRSIAATAMLQSSAATTNQFFFLRFIGGDPCVSGAAPEAMTVAANHGGEYLDLLQLSTGTTRILAGSATLATVSTLASAPAAGAADPTGTLSARWQGSRSGKPVSFRETVALANNGSTMELTAQAGSPLPIDAIELTFTPASGVAITGSTITGTDAELWFTQMGQEMPHLRLAIAGGNGAFRLLPDGGGIVVRGNGRLLRLLVTDLTGSHGAIGSLATLCPSQLAAGYGVDAILLRRDPSFEARSARMARLGFTSEHDFGAYAVLARPASVTAGGALLVAGPDRLP
jgi:hypothetical protein